jgi:hypothetical protein
MLMTHILLHHTPNVLKEKAGEKIHFHDRFLFRVNKLCIPDCSLCIMFLQEAHSGGLMGHFGVKKTEQVLINHFF